MTKRKETECPVKHVSHITYGSGGIKTPYMLDIYQAEEGEYEGEFIGIVSRMIETTAARKTIKEVKEDAEYIVNGKSFMAGITGRW